MTGADTAMLIVSLASAVAIAALLVRVDLAARRFGPHSAGALMILAAVIAAALEAA